MIIKIRKVVRSVQSLKSCGAFIASNQKMDLEAETYSVKFL